MKEFISGITLEILWEAILRKIKKLEKRPNAFKIEKIIDRREE